MQRPDLDPIRRRHRIALEAVRAIAQHPDLATPGALEWWSRETVRTAPEGRLSVDLNRADRPGP